MNWEKLRAKRNKLLAETDKFMLSDFPIDTKLRTKYRDYRDYLRNITKMYSDDTIEKAKVKSFEEFLAWKRGGDY